MSETSRKTSFSVDPVPAGNLSTGLLKLIGLCFMFIDHSGKVLFNNAYAMRVLGRLALPIYVWCMIVGFHRTRNVPRYLLRVLFTGVISQPLYLLALNFEGHIGVLIQKTMAPLAEGFTLDGLGRVLYTIFLNRPNIFLSLFLGLLALWGIREKKFLSQFLLPAAAMILSVVLRADYGWKLVVFFMLMYAVRGSRPGIAAVMVSYFLFWGAGDELSRTLFGLRINLNPLPSWLSGPLQSLLRMETYGLLALPFLLIRFPRDIRLPRWLGYALYPGHLVLLIALKLIMFG